MKPFKKTHLQWIGIGISILYWFFESVLDSFVFHQGSLVDRLFTPDLNETWMRLLVISLLIIFGFYSQSLIEKRNLAEEEVRKINEDLEIRIIERTTQLEAVNKRLEAEIAERKLAERRLLVQYAVGRILTESATFNEAAPKIIQAVCETTGWDMGAIWTIDHQANVLRCIEHRHSPSVDLSEFGAITRQFTFSKGVGLPGRIWASGKPECIVNVVKDANFPRMQYAAEAGLHGAFGFPIASGGEFLGVIEFFSREIRRPDDELLQMFTAIGNQIWQFTKRRQAEAEIENSLSLLRATLESTADGILVVNNEGKMVGFNQNFLDMWRIPESIVASRDDNQALAFVLAQLKDPEGFLGKVRELYSQPDAESFDVLEFKDGRFFERYSRPQRIGERSVGRVWSFRDVTERKRAEEAIRESEERFRSVVQSAKDAIILADSNGRIISWNKGAQTIFGYSEEEVLGKPLIMLMPERYRDAHQKGFERLRSTGESRFIGKTIETHGLRKDGAEFPLELSFSTWSSRKTTFFSGIIRDITWRKVAEEKIKHMAYHDTLTDLPNRALFFDRLHQAILAGGREKEPVALLLLDLDCFKEINDAAGHHCGDLMLQAVGQRLRGIVRKSDTVARLGGDEFALLLPGANMEGATLSAHKVLETIKTPFSLEGHVFNIGVSIGIALFPDHSEDSSLLLQKADMAMYAAKQSGKGFALYAPGEEQA